MDKIFAYQSFLDQYYSINYSNNKDEENDSLLDDDEISNPKLKLQKKLIESMFLKIDEEDENKKSEIDSIDISDLGKKLSRAATKSSKNKQIENVSITYERLEYRSVEINIEEQQVQEAEPLILDLDGDGLDLTDVRNGDGVNFDITGDGKMENVSWAKADDGFLVYDRNGNGTIDSGKELFGDQHGALNGFEELAKFDNDNNNVINKDDSIYDSLKVWQDYNQNGVSESNELTSLKDMNITEITLEHNGKSERISGNRVEGYSNYTQDSIKREVGEVFLNYLV